MYVKLAIAPSVGMNLSCVEMKTEENNMLLFGFTNRNVALLDESVVNSAQSIFPVYVKLVLNWSYCFALIFSSLLISINLELVIFSVVLYYSLFLFVSWVVEFGFFHFLVISVCVLVRLSEERLVVKNPVSCL